MKSYLKLLKVIRRYWIFVILAVILTSLVSASMGVSFLSVIPFWSKIVEGDPFVPQISLPLPENFDYWLDRFADWVNNIPNRRLMFYLIYFVLGIYTLRGLFLFLADITLQFVGNSVVRNVRSQLYGHLQTLSLDYFNEQRTGELMSRITYDAEILQRGVSEGFTQLFREFFDLVMFVALPVLIYWKLAIIVFGLFLLVMPPIVIVGNIIRRLSSHSQQKIADINSMLQETISGVRVVKAFSMEDYERNRFNRHNNRFYRIMMSMARRDALLSPVTEFVVILATAIVFTVMGQALLRREIDPAQFALYIICLGSIPRPIKLIGRANNMIQRSAASVDRVHEVLRMESTIVEQPDAPPLPPIREGVKFNHVSFNYNGKEPILEDINLFVQRGEILAIVGASGVGKSTLVNLIPRFYDPTEGSLEIDGHNLRTVTLKSVRDQIGIVTQEVILFNDTVAGNIAYGKKDTTRERIIEAAKMANAHDFILRLPQGYDTVVGEMGYMLSGGERQRIAIARAILKDPPIMILDEATSALDAESERLVQEAINRLIRRRTVFVIAHRLSTVRHADRIVVLEDKKIVQIGKHEELLQAGGPYRRLYQIQFALEPERSNYI